MTSGYRGRVRAHRVGSVLLLAAAAAGCARSSPLLRPAAVAAPAPEVFRVRFETSRGPFVVEARRSWSPAGADRLYYLVRSRFYDGTRFFRVVPRFMAQFGVSSDPAVSQVWRERFIRDDPVLQSNLRGTLTFATSGPDTRTTQLFINYADNRFLDSRGFSPVGRVVEGMAVVDSLYAGYGEAPPSGRGPLQPRILAEGDEYLKREFPRLDYIRVARLVRVPRE